MNKKGFTLIEISISIILLTIVLIFMMNFLTLLKDKQTPLKYKTEFMLIQSTTSRVINDVFYKEKLKGILINNVSCSVDICTITMNNNNIYYIEVKELNNNKRIIQFYKKETSTSPEEQLLTKKLPNGYEFYLDSIVNSQAKIILININISLMPEYQIQIVGETV